MEEALSDDGQLEEILEQGKAELQLIDTYAGEPQGWG